MKTQSEINAELSDEIHSLNLKFRVLNNVVTLLGIAVGFLIGQLFT